MDQTWKPNVFLTANIKVVLNLNNKKNAQKTTRWLDPFPHGYQRTSGILIWYSPFLWKMEHLTQWWHNARGEYRSTQRMFALVRNDTGGSQPHGIPLYCIILHNDKAMPRNIAQSSLTLKLEDLQPKTNKFVVTVSSLQEAGPSWGHPLHVWRVLLTILDIVHHCNWWTLDLQSLSIHD